MIFIIMIPSYKLKQYFVIDEIIRRKKRKCHQSFCENRRQPPSLARKRIKKDIGDKNIKIRICALEENNYLCRHY